MPVDFILQPIHVRHDLRFHHGLDNLAKMGLVGHELLLEILDGLDVSPVFG